MSVFCTSLPLGEFVGSACVQTRSSNPRDRACGPSGKGSGEEGILSGVVPVSQCRTVVPHCCKGDAASQWEMAISGVSELRNP